jgi:hypothetical protein
MTEHHDEPAGSLDLMKTDNATAGLAPASGSVGERIPHHVDILLNYVLCDNTETPHRQAMAWLEANGYMKNGEPTAKAHNGRRKQTPPNH